MKKNLIISGAVVLLGLLKVTLNMVPNFAPAVAMLLMSAAFISNKKWAFALPMLTLFIGDFLLNNTIYRPFYPETEGLVWVANPMVYLAYALIFLAALPVFKKKNNITTAMATGLGGSIIFFLVSNFGVWAASTGMYPHNFTGLMTCYTMALPFFGPQVFGDTFFTALTFIPFLYAYQGKKALI